MLKSKGLVKSPLIFSLTRDRGQSLSECKRGGCTAVELDPRSTFLGGGLVGASDLELDVSPGSPGSHSFTRTE